MQAASTPTVAPAAAVATPRKRGRPRKTDATPGSAPAYPPIEQEQRPVIDTRQAAYYVGRSVLTLQDWRADPDAPLHPIKGQRGAPLQWRVSDIRDHLGKSPAAAYPPIDQEQRLTISTRQAAYYLGRSPHRLLCIGRMADAPIRPIHVAVGTTLQWRVADIRAHLGIPEPDTSASA